MSRPALLFLALALSAMVASAELPEATALPGTIVKWPGEAIESCGMDGRQWAAMQDACWYAVDLLHPPGSIEVTRSSGGRKERALIRVGDYPYPVQHITIRDESQVNLSAEDLERVRGEQRRVGALWNSGGSPSFELPLASPLRRRGAGGRFGSRRFFNNQPRSPHTGADYAAPEGEPVYSVAAGRVVLSEEHFFSGVSVFVDHGDQLVSMYFHLSESSVEEGQQVSRGQQIGRVGASGRATGPHLHFGVRWHGSRIDPEQLLEGDTEIATIP